MVVREVIKSLKSSHLARVKALHTSRGRRATNHFLAEGPIALAQAAKSKRFPVVTVYVTELGFDKVPEVLHSKTLFVSEQVIAAMSSLESSQGLLAICSREEVEKVNEIFLNQFLPIIYCVEINDPGNLGTIIRTADAFGASGILLSPGSADPFAPKVVRASAGSLWNIPIAEEIEIESAIALARSTKREVLATSSTGKQLIEAVSGAKALWIYGNEARGITPAIEAMADQTVLIPMRAGVESLNLATSVAITLFHANSSSGARIL